MPSFIDISGRKFGRLNVIKRISPNGDRRIKWLCQCDCGNSTTVDGSHLRANLIRSCGCLNIEKISLLNRTHGLSKTPEYAIWCGMKARCYNLHNQDYEDYGGRGIEVCSRWLNSFENFLEDMGLRPGIEYSIERRNVDGNYDPINCIWATQTEQCRNRRNNRFLIYMDKKMTVAEFSELTGIKRNLITDRLDKGYSSEEIIMSDILPKKYLFNGRNMTIQEISSITGVNYRTLLYRINHGYSINDAIVNKKLPTGRKFIEADKRTGKYQHPMNAEKKKK